MSYSLDGRKIYFNNAYERLIELININTEVFKSTNKEEKTDKYNRYIYRNEKIIDKLKTYKKVDKENNIFLYLFPNELEDIMWILYENNLWSNLIKND